jgi:predicted enzyme related to lactoylglutathione lyase
MQRDRPRFVSLIVVQSAAPSALAAFYREVVGIPLRDEITDDTGDHFGCELGDTYFAIYPGCNATESCHPDTVKVSLAVHDIEAFVARIHRQGVTPLYEIRNAGFARITALRDPDGNYIEFTELSRSWLRRLMAERDA